MGLKDKIIQLIPKHKIPLIQMEITVDEYGQLNGNVKLRPTAFTKDQRDKIQAHYKSIFTICEIRVKDLWDEIRKEDMN